jgi:hypothetical protein
MMKVRCAEAGLVVDAHSGVHPSVGPETDRSTRIGVLPFNAVTERLGTDRLLLKDS